MDESASIDEQPDRNPKRFKKGGSSLNRDISESKEVTDRRRWEDLPINCLVDVFERLSLDDLTLGIPFVCKSWYDASLDPTCWKTLDFRTIDPCGGCPFTERFKLAYGVEKFTSRGFLKFLIGRSQKVATELILPKRHFPLRDMIYVCKECPLLNIVVGRNAAHSGIPIRRMILNMNKVVLKARCNLP